MALSCLYRSSSIALLTAMIKSGAAATIVFDVEIGGGVGQWRRLRALDCRVGPDADSVVGRSLPHRDQDGRQPEGKQNVCVADTDRCDAAGCLLDGGGAELVVNVTGKALASA